MRDLKTGKCPLQAGDDLKRQSQPLARILGRSYNHGSVFRRAMMMRLRPVGLYVHYTALPWTYLRYHISISRKSPPDRKGASFGNHSLQPRLVTYKRHHQSPAHLPFGPKKREKNRGMPHLEEESPRNWAAAIAIGREKIPPKKTTNREPNMNMRERERERERESKRESAEGLTHSHYCLSRLDTLAWPFLLLSRSWNELLLFTPRLQKISTSSSWLADLVVSFGPQLASFTISNPSSLPFIVSATPTAKNKQTNKQNQNQKAAQ